MIKKILFVFIVSGLLGGCALPFLSRSQAALRVDANETASVYLNGNHVGQTPYFDENLKPGEYAVRLVVENDPTKDWQTQISLSPQIVSVIKRDFGDTDDQSSHSLLQLEPISNKSIADLAIVTIPDNAIVKINNRPEGISPLTISPIGAGDHVVSLAAPGYKELVINVQTMLGYRLILSSQLARTPALPMPEVEDMDATPSAEIVEEEQESEETSVTPTPMSTPAPTATPSAQVQPPYVEIQETGTGWLRIREEPNVNATELARVDVGTKLPYLETNDTGWHKVEYEPGEEGWLSGAYVNVVR